MRALWITLGLLVPLCLTAQIPSLMPYRQGQLWGYKGNRGQVILSPRFAEAGPFQEGCAAVRSLFPIGGAGWGLVNPTGTWVLPPIYDNLYDANGGFVLAQSGGRWGLLSTNGQWRFEPRFKDVWPYVEGLARVEAYGRWGFLDLQGHLVVDCVFEDPWYFNEALVEAPMTVGAEGALRPVAGGRFVMRKPEVSLAHTGFFAEGLALVKEGSIYLITDRNRRLTNLVVR
jgi:hypothetical protein